MTDLTLGSWMATAQSRLRGTSESAGLETTLLASHALNKPKSWVLAHPEARLDAEQVSSLFSLLERLAAGEPLPYLRGVQEFYGLAFQVSPVVLIPRPETELLVELALAWLGQHPGRRLGLDVGTGSGCIAVSLAFHATGLRMVATDLCAQALCLARSNARINHVFERVQWVQTNLADGCYGLFDLVCANLPYIPRADLKELAVARYEPFLALDGGEDGLALIQQLLADLPRILAQDGLALFEIEARQGRAVAELARRHFPDASVQILQDLAGLDRLIRIERR